LRRNRACGRSVQRWEWRQRAVRLCPPAASACVGDFDRTDDANEHEPDARFLSAERDAGYGWVIDRLRGERMVWHNGALPGAHAMNAFFPRSNMEIVVLTNVVSAKPEEIAKEVRAIVARP
jgi:hypothetical protein